MPGQLQRKLQEDAMGAVDDVHVHWAVELDVAEHDSVCRATATLSTLRGTFVGEGEAHRHPDDPDVPMIGEELAIGRALQRLGQLLTAEADEAIADHESRPIHLITP